MINEHDKAWLVLAALFNLPSRWFIKDFIGIFTETSLDLPKIKGIYVVFKNVNEERDLSYKLINCETIYYTYNDTLFTIYILKCIDEIEFDFNNLLTFGSKYLNTETVCKIAMYYKYYVDSYLPTILCNSTFHKQLDKESLGTSSPGFYFIYQILL